MNAMEKTYPKRKPRSAKAAPKPSKATIALQTSFRFLVFLAQRHPILLWSGSWLVLVLVSWLAISGLTYTNTAPIAIDSPSPEAVTQPTQLTQPQRQFQPQKPATSFGLIVGVAGACAMASALLARQLRPAKPASRPVIRRSTKATNIAAKAPATSAVVQPIVNSTQVASSVSRPEATPPIMPPKIASTSQSAKRTATVVAPETRTPTLIELMDIRKQDSVTSR